jgi:ribosomal protein S14
MGEERTLPFHTKQSAFSKIRLLRLPTLSGSSQRRCTLKASSRGNIAIVTLCRIIFSCRSILQVKNRLLRLPTLSGSSQKRCTLKASLRGNIAIVTLCRIIFRCRSNLYLVRIGSLYSARILCRYHDPKKQQ